MKIATWNVNGFRARHAQFSEWLARDRPDVVCLQELKAERTQIPEQTELEGYHTYWHGLRAYSGVALHVRKASTLISQIRIEAVAREGALVSFSYVGNRDQLAAELNRRGVLLQDSPNGPVLRVAAAH